MKVARAELLRRVAELGQRRDEQEKLLQRLEVRLTCHVVMTVES